ncbi:MAG: hypothetical protein KGI75_17155 [Rhizobiaceae bacterium]|nr:hypothetical protein [Rhizobiaceae bacterium]
MPVSATGEPALSLFVAASFHDQKARCSGKSASRYLAWLYMAAVHDVTTMRMIESP